MKKIFRIIEELISYIGQVLLIVGGVGLCWMGIERMLQFGTKWAIFIFTYTVIISAIFKFLRYKSKEGDEADA